MLSLASQGGSVRELLPRQVASLLLSLSICHNVTPVREADGSTTFQAASPDEVAIVQWTRDIGLQLSERTRERIEISALNGGCVFRFEILHCFPFTSESKRMGMVVRNVSCLDAKGRCQGGEAGCERCTQYLFIQKGADTVMATAIRNGASIEEECTNMAREGLRTLVVGQKVLTGEQYEAFRAAYHQADLNIAGNRGEAKQRTIAEHLEHSLDLLGITGVEDRLQERVKETLEAMRQAGIKIWMLTGDKVETAQCIAISSRMFVRNQRVVLVQGLDERSQDPGGARRPIPGPGQRRPRHRRQVPQLHHRARPIGVLGGGH